MARLVTLEIGEGKTLDCSECPFSQLDSICGLPKIFPDCEEVNYAEMTIKDSSTV